MKLIATKSHSFVSYLPMFNFSKASCLMGCLFVFFIYNSLFANDAYDIDYDEITVSSQRSGQTILLRVAGYIKGDLDTLWQRLTRTDKPCYSEGISNQTIKRNYDGSLISAYTIEFPFPFSDRDVTVKMFKDENDYLYSWRLISGEVKKNSGYYQLKPVNDEYTYLKYKVEFNPDVSFVPDWIVGWVVRKRAPQIIHEIRSCANT